MEVKQDFQIIKGEMWPKLPFCVMDKETGIVIKATLFDYHNNVFTCLKNINIPYSNAILVNVTEAKHERTLPQKYIPWTREDVGSILFFKDKIFRYKRNSHLQSHVVKYNSFSDNSGVLFASEHWDSFGSLLENYEYSTDGTTWLPCGKLSN